LSGNTAGKEAIMTERILAEPADVHARAQTTTD
jgi:hypothetical protein